VKNKNNILPDITYESLEGLRLKVEELLGDAQLGLNDLRLLEIQNLFNKVQVYQLDLVMQRAWYYCPATRRSKN
jgi:hypothetical protein